MVFVKVRETYDLATVKNKMTVIGIHTPRPDIIKRNFPGLLMQCKAYRPYACDVRIACASVLPSDPLGVGLAEGDVAPEDLFNPILYKAMSNVGMSQLEARINSLVTEYTPGSTLGSGDVAGQSANIEVDGVTSASDEFPIYYGLLSNAHGWKHANPQSGLEMKGLVPLVHEMVYNIGDNYVNDNGNTGNGNAVAPSANGSGNITLPALGIRAGAKRMPMINTTTYNALAISPPGFPQYQGAGLSNLPNNVETDVPFLNIVVAGIIIPPSRLHQLFYRMVVEWTIEFSQIRPLAEVTSLVTGLTLLGNSTHFQNYDYSSTKKAITGDDSTILDSEQSMVSANVEVKKVM